MGRLDGQAVKAAWTQTTFCVDFERLCVQQLHPIYISQRPCLYIPEWYLDLREWLFVITHTPTFQEIDNNPVTTWTQFLGLQAVVFFWTFVPLIIVCLSFSFECLWQTMRDLDMLCNYVSNMCPSSDETHIHINKLHSEWQLRQKKIMGGDHPEFLIPPLCPHEWPIMILSNVSFIFTNPYCAITFKVSPIVKANT